MSNTPPHPQQPEEEQPVLFFSPWDENGYLSNMYLSDFVHDGRKFNCVEQFFHAAKAELFRDHSALENIMISQDPRKQKGFGRKVQGFVESKWSAARIKIMSRGVLSKFSEPSNRDIRQQLLETGNQLLIEASPYDDFWGCGWSAETFRMAETKEYPGRNELGKILMEVRDILRAEEGGEKQEEKSDEPESPEAKRSGKKKKEKKKTKRAVGS